MDLSAIQDNSFQHTLKTQDNFVSHITPRCQRRRLKHLDKYIKSSWIRPEDMPIYESSGITNFKIDGRDKSIDYNLNIISYI